MILFLTTLLIQVVRCLEEAMKNLQAGKEASAKVRVDMKQYEEIVGLPYWAGIENRFQGDKAQ